MDYMGWGNPNYHTQKNLRDEKVLYDALCNELPERISCAYDREESPIEKKIRKYFEFDDGWLFSVVEDIVYFGGFRGENGGLSITQNMGNCVAASHCILLASKIAHEQYVDGDFENILGVGDLGIPYIPYSYGVSRVYIGGVNWASDGSLGTWMQKGSMEYGFLNASLKGLQNTPQPSNSIGRLFGRSRNELDKWKSKAQEFDLVTSRQISTIEDLKQCIVVEKSPCEITSDWGFGPHFYDEKREMWIYKPSGSWAHAMQLIGMIEVLGEWFVIVRNQWGREKHKNPGRKIPKGCFVLTTDTVKRWLKDSFCFSIGEVQTEKLILNEFYI